GAKSQSNPADEFAILLNSCFDFIISSIQAVGGEIVDFAGDSVLALWEHAETGDEARHSVIAASSAALEINQRLLSAVRPVNISPIAVHSMISAGPVTVAGIGGFDSDRRLFLTGPAITDLASPSGG